MCCYTSEVAVDILPDCMISWHCCQIIWTSAQESSFSLHKYIQQVLQT